MYRQTLKSLWPRRGKLALSLVAIVLAVAFVAGAQLFTAHLQAQYTSMALGQLPDLVVAADGSLDPDRRDARQVSYTDADVARVGDLAGVARVEAQLVSWGIGFDNADGTSATGGITASSAMGWTQFPMSTGDAALEMIDGHQPGHGEVVLDETTFERSGYRIGDQIDFTLATQTQTVTRQLTLVGVASWSSGTDADTWAFMDYNQLHRIVGDAERTQLWVQLTEDADAAAVQSAIAAALPGSVAMTAQQVADLQGNSQADAMGFLQPLLLVFAGLSVIVACFMIVNTFSILVLQRTRELALLRALGASGVQVRNSVIIEALVIGLLGSTLGVLVGWGLAIGLLRLLTDGAGVELPMRAGVVVSSLLVGVAVTVLASLMPARRASRIAAVVAMRGLAARAQLSRPKQLNPATPVDFDHTLTRLAGLNAVRQPGRTVATAATLTIGLLLVGLLGVIGASAKASIAVMMPDAFGADFMVLGAQPITDDQIEGLRDLPQVASVHTQESYGAAVGEEQTMVAAQDAADYGTSIKMTITQGRAAQAANELVVVRTTADANGWELGDEVAGVINGEALTWHIVGIFEYPDNISAAGYFTDPETLRQVGLDKQVVMAAVRLVDGADLEAAKDAVREQMKQIPGSTLLDIDEYNRVAGAQVDTMMNAVYALIGLSVFIATLGIINTLSLSVVERTRELGLLRAVGMTRGQVRGLVAREALLLSVLGGALGLLLGIAAGVGLVAANRTNMPALDIPWASSGIVLVVIVLLGLLAAIGPATRAARTPVLHALAA